MVMKLYGSSTPNLERAVLPLYLAEVDVEKELELVKVNLMGGQHQSPAFKAKQPFGVIPYFEDGDFGLFESRAIAKYLVEKFHLTNQLTGKSLKERAVINQWVESESQNFHPAISPVIREVFLSRAFKRPTDEKIISTNLEKLGKVLDVYEAQLSKNKYLAGDNYSLADAFHTPYIAKTKTMDAFAGIFDNRPHVKAWVDDITSKPGFVKCTQMNWETAKPLL